MENELKLSNEPLFSVEKSLTCQLKVDAQYTPVFTLKLVHNRLETS
jgi:hypothetical protein